MMPLVLLGAGCGLGCWLAVRGLWPRPVPLDTLLARLDRPGLAVSAPVPVVAPLERAGLGVLRVLGLPVAPGTERQRLLALVGRTPERHALAKLAGCAAGAGAAALGAGVLGSVGVSLPAVVLAVLCACGAVGGWVLPDLRLAEAAERRRRAFRHALSAYLDLVNVVLAGGGGIETALHEAAAAGDGWGFAAIRQALDRSRLTGRTPWECFALLGDEVGVAELGELAASVALSGSHGARIRQSLAAKADTLRSHQVAETETAAEAATERMTVPLVVLLFGFLFFVAYPALSHVTAATAQRLH